MKYSKKYIYVFEDNNVRFPVTDKNTQFVYSIKKMFQVFKKQIGWAYAVNNTKTQIDHFSAGSLYPVFFIDVSTNKFSAYGERFLRKYILEALPENRKRSNELYEFREDKLDNSLLIPKFEIHLFDKSIFKSKIQTSESEKEQDRFELLMI